MHLENLFDMHRFWQSLALRPTVSSPFDVVDESFSQWKQPIVQQALSQVILDVKGFVSPLLLA